MLSEQLIEKWQPVLDHSDLGEIKDSHRRAVTATLLENQELAAREAGYGTGGYQAPTLLGETPANGIGGSAAPSTSPAGNIDIFDPVLISLVRRSMPNLIAYDICGVQPMTGPTGLIFAMRARFTNQTGNEALYNEANTSFSATAAGNTFTASTLRQSCQTFCQLRSCLKSTVKLYVQLTTQQLLVLKRTLLQLVHSTWMLTQTAVGQ